MFITDRYRYLSKSVPPEILAAHRTMSIMSASGPGIDGDTAEYEAGGLIDAKGAGSLLGCTERHARRLLKGARPTGVNGVYWRHQVAEIAEQRKRKETA